MAKQMKAGAGHNGYDPEKCKDFVRRWENVEKEKDAIKAQRMREIGALNEDQKSIIDEAKDAGIPKKSLKAVLKTRQLEQKAKKAREDLEADEADAYDNIRHALGELADTPLGEAVLKGKGERTDEDAAKENVDRLNEMLGEGDDAAAA